MAIKFDEKYNKQIPNLKLVRSKLQIYLKTDSGNLDLTLLESSLDNPVYT